jgi:hypothetical protein
VNQLARARELDVQRLVRAGEALEQAQRDALSGGEAGDLQTPRREEGAAIRRLLEGAETILPSASQSTLDRVAKTLRAAAATSEGRELVKAGRLTEDLEPPGFEALSGLAELGSTGPRERKSQAGRKRRVETLRRKKQEADEHSKRAAEEARGLEREAREADHAATKAKRLAATARKRAEAALEQAQRIDEELTELQRSER